MNRFFKEVKKWQTRQVFFAVVIFIVGLSSGLLMSNLIPSSSVSRIESDKNVIKGVVATVSSFNVFDLIKQGFQNDKGGIKWTVISEDDTSGVELVSINDKMPLHVHKGENHYTFVISGQGEYNQSGKIITLEPGRFILTPMMVPHSVKNLGAEPLLLLVFSSPNPFNEENIEWVNDKK